MLKVLWESWRGAPSHILPLSLIPSTILSPHSTCAGGGWAKSSGWAPRASPYFKPWMCPCSHAIWGERWAYSCCTVRRESVHLLRRSISSARWWITVTVNIRWPLSCCRRPKSSSWSASSAGSTRSKAVNLHWGVHHLLCCVRLVLNWPRVGPAAVNK